MLPVIAAVAMASMFRVAIADSFPLARPIDDGTWNYKFLHYTGAQPEVGQGTTSIKRGEGRFQVQLRSDRDVNFRLQFHVAGKYGMDALGQATCEQSSWKGDVSGQARIATLTDGTCEEEIVVKTAEELFTSFLFERPTRCPQP